MWIPVSPLFSLAIHLFVPADAPPALPSAESPVKALNAPARADVPVKATPSADPKLDGIVDNIQKTYDGTTEFTGSFVQKYTYTLLRRTQESSGEVIFKKPGLMRWDYKAPQPKAFIVDGKRLWVHQPADKNAFVNACFQQDGLTASVAFLWGQGKIREQFDVKWFEGTFGDKTDHHLELVPKTPNVVFSKLIIVVDPKSSRVKQSIVVDPSGNVNQFVYSNLKFNKGVTDTAFKFTPPEGTHVARMPGSCDAPY